MKAGKGQRVGRDPQSPSLSGCRRCKLKSDLEESWAGPRFLEQECLRRGQGLRSMASGNAMELLWLGRGPVPKQPGNAS